MVQTYAQQPQNQCLMQSQPQCTAEVQSKSFEHFFNSLCNNLQYFIIFQQNFKVNLNQPKVSVPINSLPNNGKNNAKGILMEK